jgi:hypothetical protein
VIAVERAITALTFIGRRKPSTLRAILRETIRLIELGCGISSSR